MIFSITERYATHKPLQHFDELVVKIGPSGFMDTKKHLKLFS